MDVRAACGSTTARLAASLSAGTTMLMRGATVLRRGARMNVDTLAKPPWIQPTPRKLKPTPRTACREQYATGGIREHLRSWSGSPRWKRPTSTESVVAGASRCGATPSSTRRSAMTGSEAWPSCPDRSGDPRVRARVVALRHGEGPRGPRPVRSRRRRLLPGPLGAHRPRRGARARPAAGTPAPAPPGDSQAPESSPAD